MPQPVPSIDDLLEAVDSAAGTLAAGLAGQVLSTRSRRRVLDRLEQVIERMEDIAESLSEFRMPGFVFNPADPHVVGRLVGDTLIDQPRGRLDELVPFYGSGVYALYYRGDFPAYAPASRSDTPLYVGMAEPAVPNAESPRDQGERLWRRLNDHKRSIEAATNIEVRDFDCRFLVVKTAWEATAESYLIDLFKPVWNSEINICYGFGKHGDKAETRGNTRSPWDTLHPGRGWATREGNVPNPLSSQQIQAAILSHYEAHHPCPQRVPQPTR